MTLHASIDIGSNSILLLLANIRNENIEILENHSHVTGLGRDLDKNGAFIQEAMDDSFSVLKNYSEICKKHNFDPACIIATATEASRVAQNSTEFYSKVEQELGIKVKIINAKGEAYYSAMGILFDKKITEDIITIMDIGGASTELIKVDVKNETVLNSFSMPIGAVRMNNWLQENSLEQNLNNVLSNFELQLDKVNCHKLYCVAGTMTSVGNMYLNHRDFIESEVNGLEFNKIEIDNMLLEYKEFSPDVFLQTFPFLGKRSKTIKSGLILAQSIMNKLNNEIVYISTYGLRYGTLLAGKINNNFIGQ